jgi:hypothetical protein
VATDVDRLDQHKRSHLRSGRRHPTWMTAAPKAESADQSAGLIETRQR